MKSIYEIATGFSLIILLAKIGCSNSPVSSNQNIGSVKISIKTVSPGAAKASGTALGKTLGSVTITSARVVIKEIEFESIFEDTLDFELSAPFVMDLVVGSSLHEIETIQVPFGQYKESEIEIDELNSGDGVVYTQNPGLQNRSILVQGFLDGDTNQTFTFTSDLDVEQEQEFEPPLILDENFPNTNIVLTINVDSWFVDDNGNYLDPRLETNRSKIENKVKNSIDVFEDEDDDGEEDDDDDDDDDKEI